MTLVPGYGHNSIQRNIITRILKSTGQSPKPGLDTHWALLLMDGHNGIGHIDVFRDDRVAEHWYQNRHIIESDSASRSAY